MKSHFKTKHTVKQPRHSRHFIESQVSQLLEGRFCFQEPWATGPCSPCSRGPMSPKLCEKERMKPQLSTRLTLEQLNSTLQIQRSYDCDIKKASLFRLTVCMLSYPLTVCRFSPKRASRLTGEFVLKSQAYAMDMCMRR